MAVSIHTGHRPFWAHGLPVDEQAALIRYWGHHRPISRSDLAEVLSSQGDVMPAPAPKADVLDQLRKSAGNSIALQEAARAELAALMGDA